MRSVSHDKTIRNEQAFVVQQFNKHFGDVKVPIALYGVGRNTAAILENNHNENIIGLMDVESTGRIIYGKPVLSVEQAARRAKKIVIIARDSVVNIIYKRIAFLKKAHDIEICTIHGDRLDDEAARYNNQDWVYWKISEIDLINKIDRYDTISFDIFDTLIMRKTLKPDDVFSLVQNQLRLHYNLTLNFKAIRKEAEARLPAAESTIEEIYSELAKLAGLDRSKTDLLQRIEWEVEKKCLIPRRKMVKILNDAVKRDKTVILTTDSYFSETTLGKLLENLNITGFDRIISSSTLRKSKKAGTLFEYLKEISPSTKILHIGDNRIDDIEQAHRNDIDTFHILSGYELLMASSLQNILADIENLSEKLYLGAFVARAFNNPFALQSTKGIVSIDNLFDLGYLFIGPLIIEFAKWLCRSLEDQGFEKILFPSRDGYLVNQIYNRLSRNSKSLPKGTYFKTSRRILNVTSLHTVEDIVASLEKPFKGTKREMLEVRYGISPDLSDNQTSERIDAYSNREDVEAYILKYADRILANSDTQRQRYMTYLDGQGIKKQKKYALFDFISSGTIPHFLERLLNADIPSFFFATLNWSKKYSGKPLNFAAAYGNINTYGRKHSIGLYYLFLETVLVDPDKTLIAFDERIQPLFESTETENWNMIEAIHAGVHALLDELQSLSSQDALLHHDPVLDFSAQLLGCLFGKKIEVKQKIKDAFVNDDKYNGEPTYTAWI